MHVYCVLGVFSACMTAALHPTTILTVSAELASLSLWGVTLGSDTGEDLLTLVVEVSR